jgi:hypothetical protein
MKRRNLAFHKGSWQKWTYEEYKNVMLYVGLEPTYKFFRNNTFVCKK